MEIGRLKTVGLKIFTGAAALMLCTFMLFLGGIAQATESDGFAASIIPPGAPPDPNLEITTSLNTVTGSIITIDNPDQDYLEATKKIDISGLTYDDYYNSITDGFQTVTFSSSMQMRGPVPIGWGAYWGEPPVVEASDPCVLFSDYQTSMTWTLSKPTDIFGFEAMPNFRSTFNITVELYSGSDLVGSITRDVTVPHSSATDGNAKLFAARTQGALFDKVVITTPNNANGFVVAQVRYGNCITITGDPNPSTYGDPVTFTATVTPVDGAGAVPTGTVTFSDDGTPLGTADLSGGSATLTTMALTGGDHSITAQYSGDNNYLAGSSPPYSQTVKQAPTTTDLAGSPNTSIYGDPVTFTATVTTTAAGDTDPTGTVTFYDGGTSLGTADLSDDGSATMTTSALTAGSHSITAQYSGNTNYGGSSSQSYSQTVNQASTTTCLAGAPNPSTYGEQVTFTATVTTTAAGGDDPTGTVTFYDGAKTLGTAEIAGGSASLTTSALTAGDHSITAQYSGDANYTGSSSPPYSQTVNQAPTTTDLAGSLEPAFYGEQVTFTANVTPAGATGSVSFFDGASPIGTASLNNGAATLTTTALTGGKHSITAKYEGDTNYLSSTSSAVIQLVIDKSLTATGAGTFTSPKGAVAAQPKLSGPAMFQLASTYPRGKSAPIGLFSFQFLQGKMLFTGTSQEWLCIGDKNIWLKGKGMLNLKSGYSYLLSGVDARTGAIRLQIWDKSGKIVYDNEPGAELYDIPNTPLSKGSFDIKGQQAWR